MVTGTYLSLRTTAVGRAVSLCWCERGYHPPAGQQWWGTPSGCAVVVQPLQGTAHPWVRAALSFQGGLGSGWGSQGTEAEPTGRTGERVGFPGHRSGAHWGWLLPQEPPPGVPGAGPLSQVEVDVQDQGSLNPFGGPRPQWEELAQSHGTRRQDMESHRPITAVGHTGHVSWAATGCGLSAFSEFQVQGGHLTS